MTNPSNKKPENLENEPSLCPCPSCGRRISVNASQCPKCGDPLKESWVESSVTQEKKNSGCAKWAFGIPMILLLALVMSTIGKNDQKLTTVQPPVFESELIYAEEYGDQWPFGRNKLVNITCYDDTFGGIRRPVAVLRFADAEFGLNGVAMGVAGFKDFRSLLPRDQETGIYDLKASLEIVDRAVNLCGF